MVVRLLESTASRGAGDIPVARPLRTSAQGVLRPEQMLLRGKGLKSRRIRGMTAIPDFVVYARTQRGSYSIPPEHSVRDIAIRLADRVRQLRLEAGVTQAELASRAGVTVETVARLERVLRGRSSANANPSLETLARLSGALGVEVADLLSAPSKPRPKEDRIGAILRGATPATRQRVLRIAEALVRDEQVELRPTTRRKSRKRG